MSPLAATLMRHGLAVIEDLVLPRLVADDKLAVLRHLERVFGESAAKLEAQMEHERRLRATGKNR